MSNGLGRVGGALWFSLCSMVASAGPPERPNLQRVVEITPAQSLIVQDRAGNTQEVGLAYIAIPLLEQNYGKEAHALLRKLLNKWIDVKDSGYHTGQTMWANVYYMGEYVNARMIEFGYARTSLTQTAHNPYLFPIEKMARDKKRGMWANQGNVHPQKFAGYKDAMAAMQANPMNFAGLKLRPGMVIVLVDTRLKQYYPLTCRAAASIPPNDRSFVLSQRKLEAEHYTPAPECLPPQGEPTHEQ